METHFTPRESKRNAPARALGTAPNDRFPLRLTGRHFPKPLPLTADGKRKKQKQCFVCYNTKKADRKRKDTSYQCEECDVALCVSPCFEAFHVQKNY